MNVTVNIPLLQEPDEKVAKLVSLVFEAHQKAAAFNDSSSSTVVRLAAGGSGSFRQSIVAALMTLGVRHGPIGEARLWMRNFKLETFSSGRVDPEIMAKIRVPGFGNSFFKDGVDPAWHEVAEYIRVNFDHHHAILCNIHQVLKDAGKTLYPNAAAFTAIACDLCKMPDGLEELFFVLPRLPIWADLAQ